MVPKGIRQAGMNQEGTGSASNCLPCAFGQMVLILLTWCSQYEVDILSNTIISMAVEVN